MSQRLEIWTTVQKWMTMNKKDLVHYKNMEHEFFFNAMLVLRRRKKNQQNLQFYFVYANLALK